MRLISSGNLLPPNLLLLQHLHLLLLLLHPLSLHPLVQHHMVEGGVKEEPEHSSPPADDVLLLPLLLEQVVDLEPLPHPVHVQLGPPQLLPAIVCIALLLGDATELARDGEHVLGEREPTHCSVADLLVYRVLRTDHTEPFAVGA